MFSMTKSRMLDEVQSEGDVNKRHYGKDVKFYHLNTVTNPFFHSTLTPRQHDLTVSQEPVGAVLITVHY